MKRSKPYVRQRNGLRKRVKEKPSLAQIAKAQKLQRETLPPMPDKPQYDIDAQVRHLGADSLLPDWKPE